MSLASVVGGSKDEFVTSLAALALYDGGAEITADNIKALLDASNNTVQPYWPSLFASLLKDGKIEALVFSTGAPAASAGAAVAAAGGDAPAAGGEKKAEKPKEEEVDALDGGMDMFGGGGKKGGGDY